MTTITITPVGSVIPETVDKKDFLGALENCDSVNNIVTINGKQYTLNSAALEGAGVGLFKIKGNISCAAVAGNFPNYPAAVAGDSYKCIGDVTGAGKIGGNAGSVISNGDFLLCLADTAAGNQATVGANWEILQYNIDTAALTASIAAISATGLQVLKFTKTFADFQPNGGATGEINLGALPIIGSVPISMKIKHSTNWLGGAISSVQARVKTSIGTQIGFCDVFTAVSNTNGAIQAVNSITIPNHSAPDNLKLHITTGGGFIDNLTQGSVDVWVLCFVGV